MQDKFQADYDKLIQLESDSKACFAKYENQLKTEHEAASGLLDAQHVHKQETLKSEYGTELPKLQEKLEQSLNRLQYVATPWKMDAWADFEGKLLAETYRDGLRVGHIKVPFKNAAVEEIPLMLPMIEKNHLLLISYGDARIQARSLLKSLVLRALITLNNNNTEMILIDPLGMGTNLPFQPVSPKLRGEIIYAEEDEINAQLRRLTDQIRSGKRDRRYILAAADFPSRFNEEALNRLSVIAQQGISNNIYLLLHVDSNLPLTNGFDPLPLIQASSKVYLTADEQLAHVDAEDYPFIPDTAPDKALFDMLISRLDGST